MSHPILPCLPAVFVPVSDLKRSTEWYANLLERQIVPRQHEDGIYIFDFDGTEVILDSNSWGSPSMIMFETKDIAASYEFCAGHRNDKLTDVFSDEYISVFTINSNMICQTHQAPESVNSKPAHALLSKLSHVLIHTDTMSDTVEWYETLFARGAQQNLMFGGLPCIQLEKGAHLLFDDKQLCENQRPIGIIETMDLDSALIHVLAKGAEVVNGIESRLGKRFFVFHDPDGNGFLVCETTQMNLKEEV